MIVPEGTLTVAGQAPAVGRGQETFESSLVLTGKTPKRGIGLVFKSYAPEISGIEKTLPSEEILLFTSYVPSAEVSHFPTVGEHSLSFTTQGVSITVDHRGIPAVEPLVLAGQAPTEITTVDHLRLPARRQLTLAREAPLVLTGTATVVGPPKDTIAFTGQAPFAVGTLDHIATIPGFPALALTGTASVVTVSNVSIPGLATIALSQSAPETVTNQIVSISGAGALAFTVYTPTIFPTPLTLTIGTYAPAVPINTIVLVGAATLVLTTQSVVAATPVPPPGTLTLAGYAPTLGVSSFFSSGKGNIISLTIEYDIVAIATPSETLID